MENIELIKDKLLKLKNLAERGYQGEAIAAQRALENMLVNSFEDVSYHKQLTE